MKSIKEKTVEELKKDISSMQNYKDEQQNLLLHGQAAQAEMAKRLGHELNLKAGFDLFVEKKGQTAINTANRKQFDPSSNIVILTVVIDNDHAQNPTQRLDEESTLDQLKAALEERLPGGTKASAISLKKMQKENLRLFTDTFTKFTTAQSFHNKSTAAAIQKEYRHTFSFKPGQHMPQE